MIWVVLADGAERVLARFAVPDDFETVDYDLRLVLGEQADQVAQVSLRREEGPR